jgi:uncharacterized protein YqeY
MPNAIDKIDADIKSAMLAKDSVKLGTLRMFKSALKYYQIEKKLEGLSEADLMLIAQKQIKQRQDSIESFKTAGRQDLLEKEEAELAILKSYLPKEFSPEELENLVKDAIKEVGATGKAQVGLVMKSAMAKAAGRADGKSINAMALKLLSS